MDKSMELEHKRVYFPILYYIRKCGMPIWV